MASRAITHYSVITEDSVRHLSEMVAANIRSGWQPFGNLIIVQRDNGEKEYVQAMVKYKEERL